MDKPDSSEVPNPFVLKSPLEISNPFVLKSPKEISIKETDSNIKLTTIMPSSFIINKETITIMIPKAQYKNLPTD